MIRSIVVPVDYSEEGDRALRLATRLAASSGLPVELVTVTSPGGSETLDDYEMLARTRMVEPVACTSTRLWSFDAVGSLADFFATRPAALVVMGTSAKGPVAELLLGGVTEALLARTDHPLLLVGPHVPDAEPGSTLVAAVAREQTGSLLAPFVADWARCFAAEPWFVQVAPPQRELVGRRRDTVEVGMVHRLAEQVRASGVDAQWDVLHGRSAPVALVDFTRSMGGGIVAVASERWADAERIHWSSTARTLVHRAPYPVLVVPVHAIPARTAARPALVPG